MIPYNDISFIDSTEIKSRINKESDKIFKIFEKHSNREGLTKTASSGDEKVADSEDLKCSVAVKDIVEENEKFAAKEDDLDDDIFEDRVTFVSKELKDPHYEVYVSNAKIKKANKMIWLVSYYMRELYLGRYLIKRNMYFLDKNKTAAKTMFKDLVKETKFIRKSYYLEEIMSSNIPQMTQNLANSVEGDFVFDDEESLGTTVSRKHNNESTVYEWFYRNKYKADERREGYHGIDEEDEEEEFEW